MAKYRKLGRTSDQRKALLRNQVTNLLYHGKIVTTETKAKEIRKIAESMIALAVKEKDNFETVTVTAKVARKDADGKRVKEVKDGKKVTVYDEVQKEIKKDLPSRLHARRQMASFFYPVTEVPTEAATFAFVAVTTAFRSSSTSSAAPVFVTTPPKYLLLMEMVRFTRFPRVLARSEFIRSTSSSQVMTPSFSNGISCRTK